MNRLGMRSAGRSAMKTREMVSNNIFVLSMHKLTMHQGTTGKAVLQDLVGDENHAEYRNLTDDEKAQLLQEYHEHKETKTTGIRISTKSKVNDVTQTLKAVENEVSHFISVLMLLIDTSTSSRTYGHVQALRVSSTPRVALRISPSMVLLLQLKAPMSSWAL